MEIGDLVFITQYRGVARSLALVTRLHGEGRIDVVLVEHDHVRLTDVQAAELFPSSTKPRWVYR